MSDESVVEIYRAILALNMEQLARLREMLSPGGDPTGVGAKLVPPGPGPREAAAAVPMTEWPDEYWDSQA